MKLTEATCEVINRTLKSAAVHVTTHYPYTLTATAAENFMACNVWLAKNRVEAGAAEMAGRYASDAAHYGLMLLETGAVRRHIIGAISRDEAVTR